MAVPRWSEIESAPWFSELSPEEKAQTVDTWLGDALQGTEDPNEVLQLSAVSEAKKRSLLGQPVDPNDLFKPLVESRFANRQAISDRYKQFASGELEDPDLLALDQVFKDRQDSMVLNGNLFLKPSLVWDREQYQKAVKESEASPTEKAFALTEYEPMRENASKAMVEQLALTDPEFKDYAKTGYAAGKTNTEILDAWREAMKLPDSLTGMAQGIGRQVLYGLQGGLAGLERAGAGVAQFFGYEDAQKAAEEAGKEAASFAARRQVEGGPALVGEVAEGAMSLVPTLAVGAAGAALAPFTAGTSLAPVAAFLTGLGAAAGVAGLQSLGGSTADAYEFYRDNRGLSPEEAAVAARKDGLASGLITGTVTALAGRLGEKLGLGRGVEGLFRNAGSRAAVRSSLKTGVMSVFGNATEEAIEEATDQLLQGVYERAVRDPNKDFQTIMEETVQAAKIGGILGGGLQAGKVGITRLFDQAGLDADPAQLEAELAARQVAREAPEVQETEAAASALSAAAVNAQENNAPAVAQVAESLAEEKLAERNVILENLTAGLSDLGQPEGNLLDLIPQREPLPEDQAPAPTLPDENQIQEAGGLPPLEGQPVVQAPAIEAQEGAALGVREDQEGQVTPVRVAQRENVLAQGFTPIQPLQTQGDFWEMRRIARDTNTNLDDLTAFGLEDGTWEAFVRPGRQTGSGFVDEPVLAPAEPLPPTGDAPAVSELPAPQTGVVSPEGFTPTQPLPPTGDVPTDSLPADTQPTSGDVGVPVPAQEEIAAVEPTPTPAPEREQSEAGRILEARITTMTPKAQESWTPELRARAEKFFQNPEQSLGDVNSIKGRIIREAYLESLPADQREAQQARWEAEARRVGQVGGRAAPAPAPAAEAVDTTGEPAPTPVVEAEPTTEAREQAERALTGFRDAGMIAEMDDQGRVLLADIPKTYRPMAKKAGFVWDSRLQRHVAPSVNNALAFAQAYYDDRTGQTVAKRNQSEAGKARAVFRDRLQAQKNEGTLSSGDISRLLSSEGQETLFGLSEEVDLVDLVLQGQDAALLVKARKGNKPMFLLSSADAAGRARTLALALASIAPKGRVVVLSENAAPIQQALETFGVSNVEVAAYDAAGEVGGTEILVVDGEGEAANWMARSKFTVALTAEPPSTADQVRRFSPTGVFRSVPSDLHGDAENGWLNFASMAGAEVTGSTAEMPTALTPQEAEDNLSTVRGFFAKNGMAAFREGASAGTQQIASEAQSYLSAEGFPGRVTGPVTRTQLDVGLELLSEVIPNVKSMVRIDSRAALLADANLPESAKALVRNGAQGFHYNGTAYVVQENVRQLAQHKTPELAGAAIIFHELMHRGSKMLRETPRLRALYAQWKSMVDANVSAAEMDNLVRSGYTSFSGWRTDAAKREAAQEEVFVRKLEGLLSRKGVKTFREEGIVGRFLAWLSRLLNSVFGNPSTEAMSDELLRDWGMKFVRALDSANLRESLTVDAALSALDAPYLEAVNRGDMETAQRLVDDAARAAGYDTEVFHGTASEFTEFVPSRIGNFGPGIYVSLEPSSAQKYAARYGGARVIRGYAKIRNPLIGTDANDAASKLFSTFEGKNDAEVVQKAKEAGFDAVWATGTLKTAFGDSPPQISLFYPHQIKSDDPVTYDDNGNVIPLSQRFQTESPDIRFSIPEVADTGTRRTALDTFTQEELEALQRIPQMGETGTRSFRSLSQILGQVGAGNLKQTEQLGPLRSAAMQTIGFTEDTASGQPVVSAAASERARSLALQLMDPKENFGASYQMQFGPESAATAVLQMELTRYALAMLKKGDNSLIGVLRQNWNSVMLGTYLSATAAGRVLRARSYYVSDVLATLEEIEKSKTTLVEDNLGKKGVSNPSDVLRRMKDAVRQAELSEAERLSLRQALESNKAADELNKMEEERRRWLRGVELLPDNVRGTYERMTFLVRRIAFREEELRKFGQAVDDPVVAASFPFAPGSEDSVEFQAASSAEEVRALLEADLAELAQLAASLERRTPPTTQGRPPVETEAPVDDAADENEATEAAKQIIDELKAFLKRKYPKTPPPETVYSKLKAIIDEKIANAPDYPFDAFQADVEAELEGMEIDPDVQEELIAKAWATFVRKPAKIAEQLTARFAQLTNGLQIRERLEPRKVEQLRELVQTALRNKGQLDAEAFVKDLAPKLEALTVPQETAQELAERTYKESVRRKIEQRTRKMQAIKDALFAGSNRRLIAKLEKAKPADAIDEVWRIGALRDVLASNGLAKPEIDHMVASFTPADFDAIFTKGTGLADLARSQKLAASVERLLKRYEESVKRPKAPKEEQLREFKLADLARNQLRVPLEEDAFLAEAQALGATEAQASRLFSLVAEERALFLAEKGRSPTVLSRLVTYLLSAPADVRNVPENRQLAIREFLLQNGVDAARVESMLAWIEPQFKKFIIEAKQKALNSYVKSLETAARSAETRSFASMTETSLKQLQGDLNLIRKGLGDLEADPDQTLAKALGFEGFRPEDYQTLAELDSIITRARENGMAHDMTRGLKELYELLERRKAPKTFLERMAIVYNNSALSGVGTLAVNVVAPAGSYAIRFAMDLVRTVATGNIQQAADSLKIFTSSFANATKEVEFAVVSGANINAMQQQVGRVTNMAPEYSRGLRIWRDKTKPLPQRLSGLFMAAQGATEVTRRILAATDHTWYSVMQDYMLRTETLRVLTDKGIRREIAMPLLFARTAENSDMLSQTLQRIDEVTGALNTAYNADPTTFFEKVKELVTAPMAEGISEGLANFELDLRAALRRTAFAYAVNPTSMHKHLMSELKLQKTTAYLRANDLMNKQMLAGLQKLVDPSGEAQIVERIEGQVRREAEYELGTHRGEDSPGYDVFNVASNLVLQAGSAVLKKQPLFGRMLLGYFGIPVNLLNRAMWFTPYGLIRYGIASKVINQKTGEGAQKFYQQSMGTQEQLRQRLLEAMVGTVGTGFLVAMKALSDDEDELFNITLAGPVNKTEYDAWYKMGNRKGSIQLKVGDRTASINWARGPLEPLKVALMLVGAMDDMRLNRKMGDTGLQVSLTDYLQAVMSGWSQQASFFGAKTTIGAVFGTQAGSGVVGGALYKLNPVIPFSGLIASVEKFIAGPDQFRGRESAVFANLPIFRSLFTERAVNALGDPLGNSFQDPFSQLGERLWYAGLPFTIQKKLTGMDARIYQLFLDKGVAPGMPSRAALESENGLMWDAEWLNYVDRRGAVLKQELAKSLARFQRMDEDALRPAMAELSSRASREAKRKLRLK